MNIRIEKIKHKKRVREYQQHFSLCQIENQLVDKPTIKKVQVTQSKSSSYFK